MSSLPQTDYYNSPAYQDLMRAADALHATIYKSGYAIQSASHTAWQPNLKRARAAAAKNSRINGEVTRILRQRKIVALYQFGKAV